MAKVIELHAPTAPTGKTLTDPAAASRIALGNKERQAASVGAKGHSASKRSKLNRLNREIGESKVRFLTHEAELKKECGGKIHVPPAPAWIAALFFVVGFLAEFAIAEGLLDYSFLQGRAADAITFLEHFEGRGFFEGLVFSITDYSTQKEWAALGFAFYTFGAAKITGTWVRQREAKRNGMSTWFVVTINAIFLATCVGFVLMRHASMALNPDSADLAYLAPVFLPIQLFFYSIASYVAAWLADPDPEAGRLGALVKKERKVMGKLISERAEVSAEITSILVAAQAKCDQIASQTIWDIAAYRHANLKYRDRTQPAPGFLVTAIGSEVFEPIAFDPPPDCPAHTLEEVLRQTGSG